MNQNSLAFTPVVGSMMKWIYDSCTQNAVPVFEIHGTNDNVTLWEGDLGNFEGWGAYLPFRILLIFGYNKIIVHLMKLLILAILYIRYQKN